MSTAEQPDSLAGLLQALERSENLRALARECGMSAGDLRRRLRLWRRELQDGTVSESAAAEAPDVDADWSGLPAAADLDESPLPADGSRVLEIRTDGASRGNPGPAAIGVLFSQHDGPALCVHAETIGRATNNAAEYRAVLKGLELAAGWEAPRVRLLVDSELVARQLTGQYRVKSQDLLPFYRQVVMHARGFKAFTVRHVPRAENAVADALANAALDGRYPPKGSKRKR